MEETLPNHVHREEIDSENNPRPSGFYMCDDERAFLQGIIEHPEDEAIRLIYADWLEEHQRDAQAEWLRWESKLQSQIQSGADTQETIQEIQTRNRHINPYWLSLVSRGRIEHCRRFDGSCPNVWQKIPLTLHEEPEEANGEIFRECQTCGRRVYFAMVQAELEARAWLDQLVGIPNWYHSESAELSLDSARLTIELRNLENQTPSPSFNRKIRKRARRNPNRD